MNEQIIELRNKVEELETKAAEMQKAAEERAAARKADEERNAAFYNNNFKGNTMENRTNTAWSELAKAMIEKRALSIQDNVLGDNVGTDTGRISQVSELWDLIRQREPLLDMVSYFNGPNWETQIPVLEARPAVPTTVSEGWDNNSPSATKDADIAVKKITPTTYVAILPVTYEAAKMSFVNLENRIPGLLADAYRTSMCNKLFADIFDADNIAAANKITTASASAVGLKDLLDLALAMKDTDIANPVIVMNPGIYSAIAAAEGGVYDFIKEELVRNKTVEGIRVILTGKAPSFSDASEGDIVVFGGDLKNYCFGVADQISIEPMKKLGSTNIFYQSVAAFGGIVVQPKNVFGLTKKA